MKKPYTLQHDNVYNIQNPRIFKKNKQNEEVLKLHISYRKFKQNCIVCRSIVSYSFINKTNHKYRHFINIEQHTYDVFDVSLLLGFFVRILWIVSP
jgi:hypothetical protein